MKLYIFNKEFDDEDYIPKSPTYVVANSYEEAIITYKKGPNNNEEIWSVKSLGNPVLVAEELINASNHR